MLKEIIIAIQSYSEAHRFIVKHRLWKWILIPGLIYTILFIAGFYLFWISSNSAIEFILLKSGVKAWLDNMQDSWLNFLFIVGQVILHLILLLFYFSLFKFLFLIIASPVFAYLSEKTESIKEGRDFPFSMRQLMTDAVRGIRIALRNMVWQSVYLLTILILSFIPLVGWIAPLVALFVECYYFGFSMLDYSSERNKMSYQQSIKFIGHHKGLAIGNGMVYYMLHFVPVIGWLFAPSYAVIAATLSILNAKKKPRDHLMSTCYLIPSVLDDSAIESIPAYVLAAVNDCTVIFAENERTARRFLKALDRNIVIDNFEWFAIHKAEEEQLNNFKLKISENKNIAIISEAGCPGIADPGQILVAAAQQLNCKIRPLVGPSSILLAVMASGMNGQHFEFVGYLPIEGNEREKRLRELEASSSKHNSTKIFIETPYRNNQLLESIIKICHPDTMLCIAVNLTGPGESIKTKPIAYWKNKKPDIHKQPAIFLINAMK